MKLQNLLHEIKINKKYELIDEIFKYRFIKRLIWEETRKYKFNKDEVENVCMFELKRMIYGFRYRNDGYDAKCFCNYIKKYLHNRVSQQLRKENYFFKSVPSKNMDKFEDTIEKIDEKVDLHKAINELKEIEQKVVNSLFFEGYKEKELAEELNVSRAYINKIKNIALKKLKEILSNK